MSPMTASPGPGAACAHPAQPDVAARAPDPIPTHPGRILVTPRSLTKAGLANVADLDSLRQAGFELVAGPSGRQPTHDELLALVPGCVGWLAGVEPIPDAILAAATDLTIISRFGAGTDAIDLAAAAARGIRVERAAGANSGGVAELTIALMLAALRSIPATAASLRAGRWDRPQGRELGECTVGLVGLGAIGGKVARLAAAFGARVLGHDPYLASIAAVGPQFRPPAQPSTGHDPFVTNPAAVGPALKLADLDAVLAADVVSLHCPPPADGRPLIGPAQLAAMPPDAVLVNTARSSLVDDDAVLAALDSGHLAAYAVDAFDTEPPAPSPLLAHPRVIATPHLGATTRASVRRVAEASVATLLEALAP